MTQSYVRLASLPAARSALRELWRSGGTIGSVHSLGALHEGHGKVIELAAAENDHCVVTIYPNEAQLAPGSRYEYDVERDVAFAVARGATHVITPARGEMYGDSYRTFLDQGECHRRLDATVVPFLFRGMITMCIRWMNFVRPTRAYWGLKDLGQALLVRRAVEDLLLDCEVREVPCVRYRSGIPISSRLMRLDRESLAEVAEVYRALKKGLAVAASGETAASAVRRATEEHLGSVPLRRFRVHYVKLVDAVDFADLDELRFPFILHCAVTNGAINHFDGLLVRRPEDLGGTDVLWLDETYPGEGG